ncbi:hypothetical protein [Prosthecomicrobium sp. N25]|uniref:hypothetical protein n=1 Tax=Prosthecomicrobium sp. N25 TaxID=3129254 RepID=UPI0030773AC0
MRNLLLAAAVLVGAAAATPAGALPLGGNPLGAEAGQGRAESVALYCNRHGDCVRMKRPGYALRPAPVVRACGAYSHWNGYSCVRRSGVVIREGYRDSPDVKIKIR